MQILSITDYLKNVYTPENQIDHSSTLEIRRDLLSRINLEIRKVDGLQTVYKAVLKRQTEQA